MHNLFDEERKWQAQLGHLISALHSGHSAFKDKMAPLGRILGSSGSALDLCRRPSGHAVVNTAAT